MQDKNVVIPDMKEGIDLTIFMELDDILFHTYLCDENFGYMANPAERDPDHELFIKDYRLPILFYKRPHMDDFLDYLKKNENSIETILYTSSIPDYANLVLDVVDPEREIFKI